MTRPGGFHLPPRLRLLASNHGVDVAALAEVVAADPTARWQGWKAEPDEAAQYHREQAEKILDNTMPKKFRHARIADMAPEIRDPATTWLHAYLHQDPHARPHLLLSGLTGRGKTHLGWALTATVVRHESLTRGHRTVFCYVNQEELNREIRVKPDNSHAYALNRYLAAEWLLFDDVGAGKATDFNAEATLAIINHRYDNALGTVYTSNLGMAAMTELLGARVYSRLAEAERIVVRGEDRRETHH